MAEPHASQVTAPADMFDSPELSNSKQRLKIANSALLQSIRATGMDKEYTFLNFNPCPVVLPPGRLSMQIPPGGDAVYVGSAEPILERVMFQGAEFVAAAVVISGVILDPRLKGVRRSPESVDLNSGVGEYEPKAILPIEQAFQYFDWYSSEKGENMRGVVAFEGNRSILHRKGPERDRIFVPSRQMLANNMWQYIAQPASLEQEIAKALSGQRSYFERKMRNAKELSEDPTHEMGLPDRSHEVWAQYGLGHNWLERPPEWMHRTIDPNQRCKGCGAGRKDKDALHCICGLYYDPYEAFVVKKAPVPEAQLYGYEGEQLKKVRQEIQRRKRMFEDEDEKKSK